MIFSGLLSSSASSDRVTATGPSPRSTPGLPSPEACAEFIHDEAQLAPVLPEPPDLRDLNRGLEALAAVFPDVQADVLRELLAGFDGESRLALVADALLKNRVAWVKGRWRAGGARDGPVARADGFRAPGYVAAVRALARVEFRGLPRSTVDAVLAESNHAYLKARHTLVALSARSWRFAISSLLLRRRPVAAAAASADGDGQDSHPLVVWRPAGGGRGPAEPAIRRTGCAELDRELFEALVRPVRERLRARAEAADRGLARRLNADEAERAGAKHECACCFVDAPFEDLTSCSQAGHLLCFGCARRAVQEALFGQAWLSSVDAATGTLRCLAVDADGCPGHVPADHLRRALGDDREGADLLRRLDQRLAEHGLAASALPLVHCPFCSYSEVDDDDDADAAAAAYAPAKGARLHVAGARGRALLASAAAAALACVVAVAAAAAAVLVVLVALRRALRRRRRRGRGLRFTCQNPGCGRASCLSCHKAWADVHVCHESSLVALRTQVEQAMSLAIKRVCPRCGTSFVKAAGCNKLTCPCGYKMCYVCRADLAADGYRHFCDHFRPGADPGPCRHCARCSLWEAEDVDGVLARARADAERAWRDRERRDLSGPDRAYLETGVACTRRPAAPPWTLAGLLDRLVDALYA